MYETIAEKLAESIINFTFIKYLFYFISLLITCNIVNLQLYVALRD